MGTVCRAGAHSLAAEVFDEPRHLPQAPGVAPARPLRSADFFDVERFAKLNFESTTFEKLSEARYRVAGDLTIRGVTRPVELDVEALGTGQDPWGNERIGFQAQASINRKDFGLTWNQALETGGVLVGENVEISIEVQAVKATAAAAA